MGFNETPLFKEKSNAHIQRHHPRRVAKDDISRYRRHPRVRPSVSDQPQSWMAYPYGARDLERRHRGAQHRDREP